MEDIAPELLNRILEELRENIKENESIKKFNELTDAGTVNYETVNYAAKDVGKILAHAYQNNLNSNVLPDGRMYYNIAKRVVLRTMEESYSVVADMAETAQEILNKNAGIGIKAIRPELNQNRIDGIVERISKEAFFDDIKWILDAPVRCFAQSIVDDAIKANSEFQGKAGLKPKIIRKSSGKCCEWCQKLAGIYSYPDVPRDVFRRHDNCDCTVEYDPGEGKKYQDVWSKKWKYEKEPDKIEARKLLKARYRFGNMPPEEFEKAVELWNQYEEIDIPQGEKERIYEEFDNNLSDEERKMALINRPIGNYYYTAVQKGHNQYRIIDKSLIDKPKDIVDEVLTEMFGEGWEKLL